MRTLLDVFEPPQGMVGHSAVLVAMSATPDFLEEAMARFTKLGRRQRLEFGQAFAYLMLDGHVSDSRRDVLRPGQVPGLHEFYPRRVDSNSLLHAKVALLGFAPNRMGELTVLRLAVLTGNFTSESACRLLELVWTIDVSLTGSASEQDRSDVFAAAAFIETLLTERFHRNEAQLPGRERRLTARLDRLLSSASALGPTRRKPRFIHSLERSLYEQIRERFPRRRGEKRNLLLCGSGFYETSLGDARKPEVFDELEKLGVLTRTARRVALVNRAEAGAVASWAKAGATDGWELVLPNDWLCEDSRRKGGGDKEGRRLHAKFVYLGNRRGTSLHNGWLYLGSGNLSKRGLCSTRKRLVGGAWNVEAGVVFEVRESFDATRLFWSIDKERKLDPASLEEGGDNEESRGGAILEAPPILSSVIEPPGLLRLHWRDDVEPDARVWVSWTKPNRREVRQGDDIPLNDEESPSALDVWDENERHWVVPVVDASGRIGWSPPRFDTYADALAALRDFPLRPADVVEDEDDDEDGGIANGFKSSSEDRQEKVYALHAAAELVETVAAVHDDLPATMVDDWLEHLDRIFRGSFPEKLLVAWHEQKLDVFKPLKDFPPRELTAEQHRRYRQLLDTTAKRWSRP